MNIAFNFKNFDPSEHLKEYARNRFGKLEKYIDNFDNTDIQVNLSVEKFRQMAEVVVSGDNIHISGYEETEDMYSTIDLVLDKIVAQVKKMREKMIDRMRSGAGRKTRMEVVSFSDANEEGRRERVIVKSDQIEPKPMSMEEAAEQL